MPNFWRRNFDVEVGCGLWQLSSTTTHSHTRTRAHSHTRTLTRAHSHTLTHSLSRAYSRTLAVPRQRAQKNLSWFTAGFSVRATFTSFNSRFVAASRAGWVELERPPVASSASASASASGLSSFSVKTSCERMALPRPSKASPTSSSQPQSKSRGWQVAARTRPREARAPSQDPKLRLGFIRSETFSEIRRPVFVTFF